MKSSDLQLAGYAAILSAALSIPILIFSIYTSANGQMVVSNAIQIFNLLLYIFITSTLKSLLTEYKFEDANGLLTVTIWLNVIGVALGMIAPDSNVMGVLSVVAILGLGVIMLITGIKLQKCPNDLHGLLKTFSVSMITTGICMASIVLIPIALVAWMIMGVVQGMIFLREADTRNKFYI